MKLIAEECIKIGQKLFLFCRDYNLFYSIELNTRQICLEGSIPNQHFQQSQLCRKMVFYNDEIYFIPYNMDCSIYIYNLTDRAWRKIDIDVDDGNHKDWLFLQAVLVDDVVFLFGGKYSKIVKLDLIKNTVEYINIFDKIVKNDDVFFRGSYIRKDELLWFPSANSNRILEFNTKTFRYKWIEVGNEKDIYSGILWDGFLYWLAPRKNGDILCWDGKNIVKRFSLPIEYERENVYFCGIFLEDNKVIFPALHSNLSLLLDKDTQSIRIEPKSYSFVKREENCLYKFDMESNLYIDDFLKIHCEVPEKELLEYIIKNDVKFKVNDNINIETVNNPLSFFIKAIIDGDE